MASGATALGVTCPSPPVTAIIDVKTVGPEIRSKGNMVSKNMLASSHSPHTTILVPLSNHANSGKTARSPKKGHLKTATVPATATVKESDVINGTEGDD